MTTQPSKSAWQEGYDARQALTKRSKNPYHYQRAEHEQWDEGWMQAEGESTQNCE